MRVVCNAFRGWYKHLGYLTILVIVLGCIVTTKGYLDLGEGEKVKKIKCGEHVEHIEELPAKYESVGGLAAFPEEVYWQRPEFTSEVKIGKERLHFVKFGLLIHSDYAVQLRLLDPLNAQMKWGLLSGGGGERALDFTSCPAAKGHPAAKGQWLVYTGGVMVDGPGSIEFSVEGEQGALFTSEVEIVEYP